MVGKVNTAAELPPLDSPENVRRGLEMIQRRGWDGELPGTVIQSLVRAGEVALRALEAELDRKEVKRLEARVKELEAELTRSRRRMVV